jgi:hypothetical protein
MLDRARQRLAGRADQLRYVLCGLVDPSWPKQVGGPFDLAVSAITLHNLRDLEKIFACYRAIHDLLKPDGSFLNCDRFAEGIEPHLEALREAGFDSVECRWRESPRAIVVATRISG